TVQAQTVAPIEKEMSNRYATIECRRNIKPTQDITIDARAGTSDIEVQEIANCPMLEHHDEALPKWLKRVPDLIGHKGALRPQRAAFDHLATAALLNCASRGRPETRSQRDSCEVALSAKAVGAIGCRYPVRLTVAQPKRLYEHHPAR